MVYLDHNATSPLRPEARAALEEVLAFSGNASSVHAAGRRARSVVEAARIDIASLAAAKPDEVIFTSGGTEANALAIAGAVQGAAEAGERITRLFVSAIEHDSVLATSAAIAERTAGLRLEIIPVSPEGVISVAWLRDALRQGKGRVLVACMAANNETGVIQPIREIVEAVKAARGLLLVDAVQWFGSEAVAEADYVSVSAHKIGGAQGTGALIVRGDAPLASQIAGGGQERGRRSGTENVAGIAAFAAAARAARRDGSERLARLRDRFEGALRRLAPDVVVFGEKVSRLPNTSNFAMAGVAAETAVMALDLDGVMVSSGSACSSGKVKASHVLAAMGVSEHLSRCGLRTSFGWSSGETDVDAAIQSLSKLRERVLARAAA